MTTTSVLETSSTCQTKTFIELNLIERCIVEYLEQLNKQDKDIAVDAVLFKDGPELMAVAYRYDDTELVQSDYCPQLWDADAINEGPVGIFALNEFANTVANYGLLAIDRDNGRLLFYPKA